jgi:hypothetical protein
MIDKGKCAEGKKPEPTKKEQAGYQPETSRDKNPPAPPPKKP